MRPSTPFRREIVDSFRAREWHECVNLVRHLVDEDPYDLAARALLGSLYTKSDNRNLALLQYERLLPLAVGQGDLLKALCTQKRLDDLHPSAAGNAARYRAMHEWFRYLVPRGRKQAEKREATNRVSAESLIALSDDAFAMGAEGASIHALDLSPVEVEAASGMLWVVYYGRVRWKVKLIDGTTIDEVADEGDAIVLAPSAAAGSVQLEPETPTECLSLAPALAESLGLRTARAGEAPASAVGKSLLPVPDPSAEPTLAVGVPFDRRKETRMAVNIQSRVALLGEVGTRVSPLHGKLLDLSRTGACVSFPSAQLRQAGGIYPDDVLPVRLAIAGEMEALVISARVAWVRLKGSGEMGVPPREAHMGLEWAALAPEKRSRLIHFLDEAARSGVGFST
jgi:hypothetical protein